MKFLLDTNGYVGFKLGHQELVAYLARAERIFASSAEFVGSSLKIAPEPEPRRR